MRPLLLPPRHGELLMGSHKQIPAWSCGQITDNARFDIDGGSGDGRVCSFHGLKLPEKSGCVWIRVTDFGPSVCTRLERERSRTLALRRALQRVACSALFEMGTQTPCKWDVSFSLAIVLSPQRFMVNSVMLQQSKVWDTLEK